MFLFQKSALSRFLKQLVICFYSPISNIRTYLLVYTHLEPAALTAGVENRELADTEQRVRAPPFCPTIGYGRHEDTSRLGLLQLIQVSRVVHVGFDYDLHDLGRGEFLVFEITVIFVSESKAVLSRIGTPIRDQALRRNEWFSHSGARPTDSSRPTCRGP
jgi:hypothetical protein